MRRNLFVCSTVAVFGIMLVVGLGSAAAFENVTAQEAYDMVNNGQATLIDVRTLEECYWVGMPDVMEGGLYIIPWQTKSISKTGGVQTKMNSKFDHLIEQTFGDDLGQALILMCRSGGRSTAAAIHLEDDLGFTDVYEIDNALKEAANNTGGRGGFQGTSYGDTYDGYRGYPERLPVETVTDDITDPDASVSWMDTGLPVTQDLSKAVIP